MAETASGVSGTEAAEAAPTSGSTLAETADVGAGTDLDAPPTEDTTPAVEEPQLAITMPEDMNNEGSLPPPDEGAAGEALAPQPTEPTRADGTDPVAVEPAEPAEPVESPQDAEPEATAYWKPVAEPEHAAPPSDPEEVVQEEQAEPVDVFCESSAEAEGYIAVVVSHICAVEPEQRDQHAATLRAFEGAFAASSGGISYRLTIFDADDNTAYGSLDSTDVDTSDCAVELIGDSIRLVFADRSE
ncbi:hypothetical protein KJ567_04135 [Candidatus Bipolaricaulota bacterium]|nr:hypothetical protein [Candidatus Bipolaricaulota bacterium]